MSTVRQHAPQLLSAFEAAAAAKLLPKPSRAKASARAKGLTTKEKASMSARFMSHFQPKGPSDTLPSHGLGGADPSSQPLSSQAFSSQPLSSQPSSSQPPTQPTPPQDPSCDVGVYGRPHGGAWESSQDPSQDPSQNPSQGPSQDPSQDPSWDPSADRLGSGVSRKASGRSQGPPAKPRARQSGRGRGQGKLQVAGRGGIERFLGPQPPISEPAQYINLVSPTPSPSGPSSLAQAPEPSAVAGPKAVAGPSFEAEELGDRLSDGVLGGGGGGNGGGGSPCTSESRGNLPRQAAALVGSPGTPSRRAVKPPGGREGGGCADGGARGPERVADACEGVHSEPLWRRLLGGDGGWREGCSQDVLGSPAKKQRGPMGTPVSPSGSERYASPFISSPVDPPSGLGFPFWAGAHPPSSTLLHAKVFHAVLVWHLALSLDPVPSPSSKIHLVGFRASKLTGRKPLVS